VDILENGANAVSGSGGLSVNKTVGTAAASPPPRASLLRQLWFWVIIAMLAGGLLGAKAPGIAVQMAPLGTGFIKLITMLVGPLIFCTIVNGIAHMANLRRVGLIAIKSIAVFELMTLVATIIGLVTFNLLQPGAHMNINAGALNENLLESYITQTGQLQFASFLLNIIPATFVGAFVQGNMLQILCISVLSGISLVALGPKAAPVTQLLDAILALIFGMVRIVMWVAPIGAFGAIAFAIGKFGLGSVVYLGKFVGEFYLACIVLIAVLALPVVLYCRLPLVRFLLYFKDEILLSMATTSSEVVLPQIIEKLKRLGCDDGVVGLVVPAGYSFNLTGLSIYMGAAVVFLAQATNSDISLVQQIGLLFLMNITAKGAAGISGAAFVVLVATMSMSGLVPVASATLILGIHRLLSQVFTPTFVVSNTLATVAIAKWEGGLDEARMHRVLGEGR
jgi:aerobic C4-dicarboxylate transport protein